MTITKSSGKVTFTEASGNLFLNRTIAEETTSSTASRVLFTLDVSLLIRVTAVSYTHLDVYKRQIVDLELKACAEINSTLDVRMQELFDELNKQELSFNEKE